MKVYADLRHIIDDLQASKNSNELYSKIQKYKENINSIAKENETSIIVEVIQNELIVVADNVDKHIKLKFDD
ncbi:hypothetical protein ABNX05_11400 [Lysinibacillus sp. M3]|uniref:Uncharacterized protein n=1 Tax=Lysinibacillus zambalensis TaxID=3160866 RepID=A0ABV1MTJ6_9BACI